MEKLNKYGYNVYSQNGEDGIIQELLKLLHIDSGWVVEFGACDGKYLSNTFNLVENNNFNAVYIEGDETFYKKLLTTSKQFKNITPLNCFIQPTGVCSLTNVLEKTLIPVDFEILSIDVDGIDYHIWENFEKYSPQIVIIEINSSFKPDIEIIHSESNPVTGSSFLSTLKLGINKGYTLVCHTGNMFFLRNDLLGDIQFNPEYIKKPELLFITNWI